MGRACDPFPSRLTRAEGPLPGRAGALGREPADAKGSVSGKSRSEGSLRVPRASCPKHLLLHTLVLGLGLIFHLFVPFFVYLQVSVTSNTCLVPC